jgi:hypothetical protein
VLGLPNSLTTIGNSLIVNSVVLPQSYTMIQNFSKTFFIAWLTIKPILNLKLKKKKKIQILCFSLNFANFIASVKKCDWGSKT